MASIGYHRIVVLSIACVVAAARFVAAIPDRAIAWVRDLWVGLVDARPFRDLFETPSLLLASPAGHPIEPSLAHRQRHEAGLARLASVRHI